MDYAIPRTLYEADHEAFRRTVRQFIRNEVQPEYPKWEEAGITPRSIWRRAGAIGILGTSIPTEYDGAGGGFKYDAIVMEELGYWGIGAPSWDLHSYIVAPYLVEFGSEEQKRRWLPGMASGEVIASIGMTEPDSGSDLKGMRTSARRDGDHYVINGAKTFITNGINGDLIVLAAKTEPALGAKGVSLFLVDTSTPGYRKGRNLHKIGNKGQDTAQLFFDDVRVPASALLGEENEGWRMLMHGLVQERLIVAIRSLSMCEAAYDQTLEYVRTRKAFGNPILEFQNTRFKLAEVSTAIDSMRPFLDQCIALHAQGKVTPVLAAKAKLGVTEVADRVIDACLQLHGGYGYTTDFPISRLWTDARLHRIYAGTNEVMKHIIGKAL
jgi:long-chain-acyl-CoA dehydrogenase